MTQTMRPSTRRPSATTPQWVSMDGRYYIQGPANLVRVGKTVEVFRQNGASSYQRITGIAKSGLGPNGDLVLATKEERRPSRLTQPQKEQVPSPLSPILRGARYLGGIFDVGYHEATVITSDAAKEACGGVPKHAFLLATRIAPSAIEAGDFAADDEVVLLSVLSTAKLPQEEDLMRLRLASMQDAAAGRELDPTTKAWTEDSGLACKILGTFYSDTDDTGEAILDWGDDVDTVYQGVRYFVYMPGVDSLSFLASFSKAAGGGEDRVAIGHVRFASTRRRAKAASMDTAQVSIRVEDFISRKSAVLGMTRSGKSNTNKIISTAVFAQSQREGRRIGQLIFDPHGEYANTNDQDGTSLRLIGKEWVLIYRLSPDERDPQERAITYDFYDRENIEIAHSIVIQTITEKNRSTANSSYVAPFETADLEPPPDGAPPAERQAWGRRALVFYALLAQANFEVPRGWRGVSFQMDAKLVNYILSREQGAMQKSDAGGGWVTVKTKAGLITTMSTLCDAADEWERNHKQFPFSPESKFAGLEGALDTWLDKDAPFFELRKIFRLKGTTPAAAKLIAHARPYHNPSARGRVSEKVLKDLEAGRIVIFDLSRSNEHIARLMAERVVRDILADADERFCDPKRQSMPIQILVEEAHRLFTKERVDANDDPWVRIAKEATKYKLGLQYATQEVTSVDSRILEQTDNWVIAHLNSDRQTSELSHYTGFGDYAREIQNIEDVGYVRLKTLSGRYVIPLQVSKFDHAMVNMARAAAGLPPVGSRNGADHVGDEF